MKSLQDLTDTTSAYELFTYFYWKILDGEVRTFAELVAAAETVPESNRKTFVLRNGFLLIRRLYWGFFRDLTREEFPQLWERLTLPVHGTEYGADLKRNMMIANVYAAFIDIHGYTAFCRKAGRNTSLLRLLDESIEKDIRNLCRSHGVLCNRLRGDEIVMIGATAAGTIRAVIGIAAYFASRKNFTFNGLVKGRTGNSIILPEMKVSAGIAGGRRYTPLIITESGDLSGSVVNTASRLQSAANRLSGSGTRVFLSEYVYIRYREELRGRKEPVLVDPEAPFIRIGPVAMKGLRVPVVEALVDPAERYRVKYRGELERLRESLKNALWSGQIFMDLANLLVRMVRCMAPFSLKGSGEPSGNDRARVLDNRRAVEELEAAASLFFSGKDFELAVRRLSGIAELLSGIPGADPIVLKFAEIVLEKYRLVCAEYRRELQGFLESRENKLLSLEEITTYGQLKSQVSLHREFESRLFARLEPERRKILWQQGIGACNGRLEVEMYVGK